MERIIYLRTGWTGWTGIYTQVSHGELSGDTMETCPACPKHVLNEPFTGNEG